MLLLHDPLHRQDDQQRSKTIVDKVQYHTGPDRVRAPAQEGESQSNDEEYRERAGISMSDGEEERTENNSPAHWHGLAKTRKEKASKKDFFAKWGDKNGGKQRRVCGDRCNFAALKEHLVVGLQV